MMRLKLWKFQSYCKITIMIWYHDIGYVQWQWCGNSEGNSGSSGRTDVNKLWLLEWAHVCF